MPPTSLRVGGGTAPWPRSPRPRRSYPGRCRRWRLASIRARRPGSGWPTGSARARRSCSSRRRAATPTAARPRPAAADAVGGTGKTQLAVGFAHQMWSTRSVDLLVWVAAGNRAAIVSGYARAAADLNLAEAGGPAAARPGPGGRDRRRRRAAVPRLAAPHPAPLGGRARRGDVAGRPRRAVAAGPAGQVVVTSRLRAQELAEPGARADRLRRHRVQPAGGGRLPQHPAGQLPRPADRGARPGRGHRAGCRSRSRRRRR